MDFCNFALDERTSQEKQDTDSRFLLVLGNIFSFR